MAENREFLSIPEAAALMGVSRIAVFKKVKKGQLAAIRIGRNWAIAAATLQNTDLPPAPRTAIFPVSAPPKSEVARAGAPATPKPARSKNTAVRRPAPVYKPVPEKDSLDEMGWD